MVKYLLLCLLLTLTPRHVDRVIDGDTYTLFHVGIGGVERVRVLGVDAPERGQPRFQEAADSVAVWLARRPHTIAACRRDGFGRLLALVTFPGSTDSLHVMLITAGLGVRAP